MTDEFPYGHMVHEYYVQRLRAVAAQRSEARARVRTPDQVRRLCADVRRKLRAIFGPFPQRTPLRPRVTGLLQRPDCTIEKVIFESRPGFPVTANLYVPRRGAAPFPVVLVSCGHSQNGKAYGSYQAAAQNFARQGYLTLIYDPVSQGERVQYPRREGAAQPRGCCQEHNMMGSQLTLLGDFFGSWRLWDGIRALDYLLSRPEADRTRVGVTGCSGGGTLTTYLTALDGRFTMAAPSCFVTRYLCNLENELPADSEQIPPGILAAGLDIADFFVARIPRPTIFLGQKNDYFDPRGLRVTFEELRRLYAIVGAEEEIQLFIGPTEHSFSVHQREAAYRFFNRHAGVKAREREAGPERPEKDEVLCASPKGQVHFMGVRRVADFIRVMAQPLAAGRELARRGGRLSAAALAARIERRLNLPQRAGAPHYRVLRIRRPAGRKSGFDSSFAVETEPGIQAILHLFHRSEYFQHFPSGGEATLCVPHRSSREEAAAGKAPPAPMLFALDARGIGELTAQTCGDRNYLSPYGSDYMYASHAMMLNESYCGRRAHDLLCALDLLQANGWRSAHLVGRGAGAIAATFAACLHPLVKRVTLHNALLSYHELTEVPVHSWPLSSLVRGVLQDFDLPDCYRALAGKKLTLVAPWDSQMRPWQRIPLRRHLKALGLERVKIIHG